jgi:hypothetical protein
LQPHFSVKLRVSVGGDDPVQLFDDAIKKSVTDGFSFPPLYSLFNLVALA